MQTCFALVDCNNFFASCERVFNPGVEDVPVIVLSNNDGCVIARSQEAKALGIKMAEPVFKCREIIKKYHVRVFSTNFTLYGDFSNRVMNTLKYFSPDIEVYSIDEAFLSFENFHPKELTKHGYIMRDTIKQWTGIPVSIGFANTKTLAKAANELAKKNPEFEGVLNFNDYNNIDFLLEKLPVEDVWGVGRQYTKKLNLYNIHNAKQLKNTDEKWIKKNFTVMGLRTVLELRGEPCIPLGNHHAESKTILCSRTFYSTIKTKKDLTPSIANFAARVSEKLRSQKSLATHVTTFIRTNRFKQQQYYSNSYTIALEEATSYSPSIISGALKALDVIFRDNREYKQAGVLLSGIIPVKDKQLLLNPRSQIPNPKNDMLMGTIDFINKRWGNDTLKTAAEDTKTIWFTKQQRRSPRYTTRWDELRELST